MERAPDECVACGGAARAGRRLQCGTALRECATCGTQWWGWTAADFGELYDERYFQSADVAHGYDDYRALEAGVRRTARARLRTLRQLGLPACGPGGVGRLYEIGCGTGVFLDEARRSGWDVAGCELSAYGAQAAQARGLAVREGRFEDQPPASERYDALVLWDVLEHLPNPAVVLTAARRAMRVGGVLALSTGDVSAPVARLSGRRWHLYNLPEHLYFFTACGLRVLLERVGFEVCAVRREVNWVPLTYIAERLLKRQLGAKRLARRCLPSWVVPATLGDVVGLYARKASRQPSGGGKRE